jgi:GH24 family phage-related lysozyme (muramidase)
MPNYLKYEISIFEGIRHEAYDDTTGKAISLIGKEVKGNITIGIGFNMNSRTARQ